MEVELPQNAPDGDFTALLASCQRPVFLSAMSLVRNVADAEEVVQRCRVILWEKFHEYRPGTNFVGWACQIARYEALKLRQSRLRGPQLFSNEFLAMFAVPTDDAYLARLEMRRAALAECMKKLPASDRELVVRRYHKGGSTRGVAEALHRSVQGTRRSLQRIREALARCVRSRLAQEKDE